MPLVGKVGVVTGVTSGVGRAVASVLTAQGAAVVGMGRRAKLGEELADALSGGSREFRFVPGDVRRFADCARLIETAIAQFGGLDIVVNAAGTAGRRPALPSAEVTAEEWQDVIDVNLSGAFYVCRHALPHLCARGGGVILNIASFNAVEAVAGMAAYNASKAGLVQLSRTLAVECLSSNVRVNAILLGGVDTQLASDVRLGLARLDRGDDWQPAPEWTGKPPAAGRTHMTTDDLAQTIALLCSDEARFITGATIAIDRAVSAGSLTSRVIHASAAAVTEEGSRREHMAPR